MPKGVFRSFNRKLKTLHTLTSDWLRYKLHEMNGRYYEGFQAITWLVTQSWASVLKHLESLR
jgi:hypothetical protein